MAMAPRAAASVAAEDEAQALTQEQLNKRRRTLRYIQNSEPACAMLEELRKQAGVDGHVSQALLTAPATPDPNEKASHSKRNWEKRVQRWKFDLRQWHESHCASRLCPAPLPCRFAPLWQASLRDMVCCKTS